VLKRLIKESIKDTISILVAVTYIFAVFGAVIGLICGGTWAVAVVYNTYGSALCGAIAGILIVIATIFMGTFVVNFNRSGKGRNWRTYLGNLL
jgi:uncharacterized protein YacL